ncbi:hypothetical protein QYF61_022320 [Mycteria americana]|uniref:Uncharacterized protein n=1 Tax=Mycteria americana TaxID=33587 RepID=A0AAN7S476_MYCAM|nr:hypothetical protein QYF61_022320 [Mycteria americana]
MSRDIFNQSRLLRAPSNLTLKVSRDGASTTSLGNLCQCFTTFIIKNFFLISSLNLPSFTLKPLPLVLSQQALPKRLKGCNKVSPGASLLQAEQPQLSQPFFIGEVLQPSDLFCSPPLDLLQQVHVFPVLRAPELDAIFQDMVGLLGCERTLLAHAQLFIHQYPQVLLGRAALNPFIPQPLVQVPLHGIPSLRHVNRTTQLGVICRLAEGALDPTAYVIDEDTKQYWSQYRPLRDTTSVDHYLLDATIQPIPHPPNSPPIKSVSLQLREEDVVGDRIEGLTEVQTTSIALPLYIDVVTPSEKATRLVRQDLPLVKPCWLSRVTSLSSMCLSRASRRICSMIFPGTEVPQVVMNLIFSYSGKDFAPPVPVLRPIHSRERLPVKTEAQKLLSTSVFSSSIVTSLPVLLITKPLLLFFASLAKFSSICALAFLTPSLHKPAASVYFSQHTCPCFHCLCISFLPFSLTSSHASPLPSFPDFLHLGIKSSWALWKASLKICQLCSAPLSLRAVSQGGPDFTLCLTHIPQDCELHQRMITAAQAASSLDVTN